MNWLIKMYRSLYLLSVPEDKTVIRSGFSSLLERGGDQKLPPQQHPTGDNYNPGDLPPYQLDPNDDDMSRLQETPATYEYRDGPQEERKRDVIDWDGHVQGYYYEQDRRDYERDSREYERGYDPIEDFYEYASRSAYHN